MFEDLKKQFVKINENTIKPYELRIAESTEVISFIMRDMLLELEEIKFELRKLHDSKED